MSLLSPPQATLDDAVQWCYPGTRIAKLAPGALIRVEVIGKIPKAFASEPKIGDLLP